ncbi:YcjX family protein [Salaquimonas pukyongi]|uniref:YcjX family protein n=1 Tax=Salaquimonas pukyongi TaxID=2712698 RepID=UPI00096BB0DA|nr:YcjX family protein [Salaquimonas pukyongi]
MASITNLADEALIALDNLQDSAKNLFQPTVRLGVTGLSRSGKTVFITALVHNLLKGGRLPLFEAHASGRIAKAQLNPQPTMDVPRFSYEEHIKTLVEERAWPDSTRAISELRLTLHYESASAFSRRFGAGTLNIDIVDYPGEWLLDLPLLGMTFTEWSRQALELAQKGNRKKLAEKWLKLLAKTDAAKDADENRAIDLAREFTGYLKACREDETALSTLPPGRFLMPGDLKDSPALTFSPLDPGDGEKAASTSLYALMAKRFEAYKDVVVRPFFREHFARLDRQIVLVDPLQAINAGPEALGDLEHALADILRCFRAGSSSWLPSLVLRRIDKILFAATKADHLHHENHQRLEAILNLLVNRAVERAHYAGAKAQVLAMAAVRATKEGVVEEGGETFPVILGEPISGETIGDKTFDGKTQTAVFPGDLPKDVSVLLDETGKGSVAGDLRFVRFRPPKLETTAEGLTLSLPHIRLDRALEFLLGDQLA